jgi:hypothetical protein
MTRYDSNAFLPDADSRRSPGRSLAALVSPMRATLAETENGFLVEIDPMRAQDALEPLMAMMPGDQASVILFTAKESPQGRFEMSEANSADSADAEAHVDPLAVEPPVLDHDTLREMVQVSGSQADELVLVLIDGPVDAADVEAIGRAVAEGESVFDAELRTIAILRATNDRVVAIETRERRDAAAFAAENFRYYLAALRNRKPEEIASPEPAIVEGLLEQTGRITVRPIETSVYSTSIDVGVSTLTNGQIRPADAWLIYDIVSNSWHGE